ncbi:MAG: hypothetical protein SO045_00545 [Campylobacter sp.]|nr:hypothetical protein [Campylobacter sp.]MDY4013298.1 hypothetical protein [Campylobacter sp.]
MTQGILNFSGVLGAAALRASPYKICELDLSSLKVRKCLSSSTTHPPTHATTAHTSTFVA